MEGKSDFAILRGLFEGKKVGFKVVPAHGATTLGALIGLLRGWGWSFAVLLDSDPEGQEAADKYVEDFGIGEQAIRFSSATSGLKEIEDLLNESDRAIIASDMGLGGKLTKKQIYRFFIKNAHRVKEFKLEASSSKDTKGLAAAFKERIKV